MGEKEARDIVDQLRFSEHALGQAAMRLGKPACELIYFIRANLDPASAKRLRNGCIQICAGILAGSRIQLIVRKKGHIWQVMTVITEGILDVMIGRAIGRRLTKKSRNHRP